MPVFLRKAAARGWHSPTFTTWCNLLVRSVRLFAVTPLLLRGFDTTEIAAWYLFGSLSVFGSLVQSRLEMTISRMVSFSMAGATDLSSLSKLDHARGDGSPHWNTVARVYGCMGFLCLVTALLIAGSGLGLGYYSLSGLLETYGEPQKIWTAFLVILGAQCFGTFFSRYGNLLHGMNFVALNNRWSLLFSVLSTASGFVVLSRGYGIVTLAVVMQSVNLLGVVRQKILVGHVHDGVMRGAKGVAFDREIIAWIWPPFWRGLLTTVANRGVLQFGSVVYARHAPVEAVAAYLFSLRMLQTASAFAEAPVISYGPSISRLMAAGKHSELRQKLCQKISNSQWLMLGAALGLGLAGPYALRLIDANARFLAPAPWAVLSFSFIMQRFVIGGLRVPALANVVTHFKSSLSAAVLSYATMATAANEWGIYGLCLALFGPFLAILNLQPFRTSARMLSMKTSRFLASTNAWLLPVYALCQIAILAIQTRLL